MSGAFGISLERVDRDDPEVLRLYADFIHEADGPLDPAVIDLEAEIAAGPPADLMPPGGAMLLARVGGRPAAIGGVRHLGTDIAEVKSMYVDPEFRGAGLASRVLAELEAIARGRGCRVARLDTSAYLTPAVGLYRSAGYREVPDYNGNPKADLWFERRLDEPIELCAYDPAWPQAFDREREALELAIGPWAVGGIHHVGSTAVLGMEAKPIIDILVGVGDLESSRACFAPIASLGYLHSPYLAEEMHWFCKPDPARRTHHLHLIPVASARYRDELAFRDRLRADPDLARAYVSLKRELAIRHRDDREAYTDAKGGFISRALTAQL
jgi:GrpB-like predicted nucleotidyltransferase (UPF0157 family)/ribosomal protein S18 acetylase RimI-like enzyme